MKTRLSKSSVFSYDLMLYQIKTILVTLTLFRKMGKSCGLKNVEKKKNADKVHLNVLRSKSCRAKSVAYLSFDVNMKEIVKQSFFNFQGCEFHGLITVRD